MVSIYELSVINRVGSLGPLFSKMSFKDLSVYKSIDILKKTSFTNYICLFVFYFFPYNRNI